MSRTSINLAATAAACLAIIVGVCGGMGWLFGVPGSAPIVGAATAALVVAFIVMKECG